MVGMDNPNEKPAGKKPRKHKVVARVPDLAKLLKGLLDWHLVKINGDPQAEYFEILLHEDGLGGGCMAKFVMGDFEESRKQLKQQLEDRIDGIDMYAYAYNGHWTGPTGVRHEGAIVTLETRTLKPTVLGFVIKRNDEGTLTLTGQPHNLGIGDWSLFHRAQP